MTAEVERRRAGAEATVVVDAGIVPLLRTQFGQRAVEEAPVDPMRSRVRVTAPTEQLLARGLAGWAEYLEVEAPPRSARSWRGWGACSSPATEPEPPPPAPSPVPCVTGTWE